MTLAYDTSASADGPLRPIDSRWKIAAVAIAIVVNACLTTPFGIVGGAAVAIAWTLDAGVSGRTLLRRLLPIVGMLLLFFAWPILWPGTDETPWHILGLPISPRAVLTLVATVGRTIAIATLFVAVIDTTPMHELGAGAAGLGAPRVLIHLVLMTHRYIFVLAEEFARLRRALRVRGYRNRLDRRTFATIGSIAGTLFVRGHERAERVHHAMLARGFDGVFRTMTTPRTTRSHLAFLSLLWIGTGVFLVVDRGWLRS